MTSLSQDQVQPQSSQCVCQPIGDAVPSVDLSKLTKEQALNMPLSIINTILPQLRAEITESTCWVRQLVNELHAARQEYTHLSNLQTTLIIRQAELEGRVQVLPPPRAERVTKIVKQAQDEAAKEKTLAAAKKTVEKMSTEEREALLAQLASVLDVPLGPLSK